MSGEPNALFLSLRPRFADLLLRGHKTVELRRTQPTAPQGTLVLLYASSPVRAVVGRAVVDAVEAAAPGTIWRRHGTQTGLTRGEYDEYFVGAGRAVAITLAEITPLSAPLPLADIRDTHPGFRPPQSFRYLGRRQLAGLNIGPTAHPVPDRVALGAQGKFWDKGSAAG